MIYLRNFMEDIVEMYIDKVIRDVGCCNCADCRMDITAMTLNHVHPKYIVTHKGEAYSKLNLLVQQFEVDVIMAITKSAQVVNSNPRHKNEAK